MAFFLIMVEFFLVCLFLVFIAIFKDITVRKDIWKLEKMYHKLLTNHHIKYFHVTWASTRRFHLWIWNYLFKEELPEELIICILSRELNWRVILAVLKEPFLTLGSRNGLIGGKGLAMHVILLQQGAYSRINIDQFKGPNLESQMVQYSKYHLKSSLN